MPAIAWTFRKTSVSGADNRSPSGSSRVPSNGEVAVLERSLARIHGDPADRITVVAAMKGHTPVAGDQSILDWCGEPMRLDAQE